MKKKAVLIAMVLVLSCVVPFVVAQDPVEPELIIEKNIIDAEYEFDTDLYFVPIFTNTWWDLEIEITNDGVDPVEDVWVFDAIGAKLRLVVQDPNGIPDDGDEYIFTIDGTPIPLGDDDDVFKGEYDGIYGYIKWWPANKKYDPIKNPCATKLMWNIASLDSVASATLEFRIETIQFMAGPHTKQAFTSTCHHSLNDGALAIDEFEGVYYNFWSNPVTVSVFFTYDQDPEADSDIDGLYDWEEVEGEYGYVTDPCNWDTDGDGFGDKFEIDHDSDPTDPESFPPYFTRADLVCSTDGSTWSDASDSSYSDYAVELDCLEDWHYLDLDEVEVTGGPLADGYNEFYLSEYPVGYYDYWDAKGVNIDDLGDYSNWEGFMWDIINGDLPIFLLKVNAGSYMLVDGLQYFVSGCVLENPLRVNGDYYQGLYEFTGSITNTLGAWSDVEITIEFYRCCPCIEDMTSNIEILTSPPTNIKVGQLESNDFIRVWKEFQGPLPNDLYYDLAEGQNAKVDGPAATNPYIPAGTGVCIYYVHLDGVGSVSTIQKTAQITFGDEILGLIISGGNVGSFANKNLMFAADNQIGNPGTLYPTMTGNDLLRGLDVNYGVNTDNAEFNDATVDFTMYVVNAHDSFRIILPCTCCGT